MNKIFKKAKKIGLSKEEKESVGRFLFDHIKNNPVRNETRQRLQLNEKSILSINLFKNIKTMPALIALGLFLLSGAGITVASNSALPGDILHPVKVNVVENMRSALSFSPESKAEFEIKRADKRLREIEELAEKGKLNTDLVEKAEKQFSKHVDKAVKISSVLKSGKKSDEAASLDSSLETMLLVHDEMSDKMKMKLNDNKLSLRIEDLNADIKIKIKEAGGKRSDDEKRIKSGSDAEKKEAAEGKLKAAENKIVEVKSFLDKNKEKVSDKIFSQASDIVKEAEDAVKEGKNKMAANENGDAFVLFQKAIRLAQAAQHLTSVASIAPSISVEGSFKLAERIKTANGIVEVKIETENDNDGDKSRGKKDDNSNSGRGNGEESERARLRARLTGDAISGLVPSGHADFEKRTDRIKFSVEAEDVNLSQGTELKIFVGTTSTTSVGTLILNDAEEKGGDFNIDSRDGKTVSEMKKGDIVRIIAPDGKTILTGKLETKD